MQLIQEAVSLLNRGETAEAIKCFRKHHNIVNRFRCKDCGHTTNTLHNGICPMCSGDAGLVVILEATQ